MDMGKVMLVDDDESFLEETAEMLRASGYAVVTADSPDSAFDSIRKDNPDIVLVDYIMKGNGGGLVSKLKSDDSTSDIPIVMISATPLEKITRDLEAMSEKAIIHGFMEKPLDPEEIITVIETNIDRR
jgi:CheY-like chemotaxis protein